MMKTLTQEIFAVGKWNGFEFTLNDLRKISTAFHSLKDVLQIPLKMGHNAEQPMTDGQPALGWVSDVSVNESMSPPKLVAEFTGIPEVVFSAMERGLYKNVSIELDFDVTYKEQFYDFVLTGVALLGADLPAVNVLNDLTTYMSRDRVHVFALDGVKDCYAAPRHQTFTMGAEMNELDELKIKLAEMKAKAERDALEFKKQRDDWSQAEKEREAQAVKAKFEADRKYLTDEIELLIKAKQMMPNQRDAILKDISADNIGTRLFAVETIKQGSADKDLNASREFSKGSGSATSEDDTSRPDEQIMQKIAAARLTTPGLSFTNAKHQVFRAHPELARRYFRMDGMIED
jgi:hypothetical protein